MTPLKQETIFYSTLKSSSPKAHHCSCLRNEWTIFGSEWVQKFTTLNSQKIIPLSSPLYLLIPIWYNKQALTWYFNLYIVLGSLCLIGCNTIKRMICDDSFWSIWTPGPTVHSQLSSDILSSDSSLSALSLVSALPLWTPPPPFPKPLVLTICLNQDRGLLSPLPSPPGWPST